MYFYMYIFERHCTNRSLLLLKYIFYLGLMAAKCIIRTRHKFKLLLSPNFAFKIEKKITRDTSKICQKIKVITFYIKMQFMWKDICPYLILKYQWLKFSATRWKKRWQDGRKTVGARDLNRCSVKIISTL